MNTINPNKIVTLESSARFSKSLLWEYQKDYFVSQGINAWIGAVPFYVTSNTLIAYSYVQIVIRFIQDQLNNKTLNVNEPIYIFELGTGSGKFSYLFITHFAKMLKQLNLEHLKCCYVMTDFTDANLQYWQNHAQLKPYVEKGLLDFAIYNIGQDAKITLVNKNITISRNSCANPVAVIANYVFDTVTHDAFNISRGELKEGLLEIKTQGSNINEDNKIKQLEALQTHFSFKPIKLPYYGDPTLNKVLEYYQQHLKEGTFLIPIGGLQAINNFRDFANEQVLVIAGDKAYTSIASLENLATPHIAFHGSFSMMVNFDAVARYVNYLGGESLLAFDSEGFKINVFCLGDKLKNLPETRLAYYQYIEHFSTKDFLPVKNKVIEHASTCNLIDLIATMKLSYWDPDIMMSLSSALVEKLRDGNPTLREEFRQGLATVYENYYFIPNNKNVLFEVGYLYHVLNELEKAYDFYMQSIARFGKDAACYFNLGLCSYNLHRPDEALDYFHKTLGVDPNYKLAKEWIEFVQKEKK